MNTGGFGQPSAFNFGGTQQAQQPAAPLFGQPQQQQQTSTFNFGTPQQQQPQSNFRFQTPSFGTTTTAQPAFGSAFGTTAPAPTFGTQTSTGFGIPTTSTGFGTTAPAFGAAPAPSLFASSVSNTFGTQSQPTFAFPSTNTNLFGSSTAPAFGASAGGIRLPAFGTTTAGTTGFSTGAPNFAFSTGTQPGMLAPLQQPQQQIDPGQAFYQSIFQCNKFGDERDIVLANFNYLQASLGIGKGYYSQTLPPVNYTSANPMYRFKAIGYSCMYPNSNEDGLVTFEIKSSAEKVRCEETHLIGRLQGFLNRSNVIFKIAGVKATSEEQSLVNVYAEDQATLRRIVATELAGIINQPHLKPNLESLGISNVSAKVKPSPEQLKRYLETPPEGIDPRVWKQAQEDNPDPERMVPAPVIGVEALKKRIHAQEMESAHHDARLLLIRDECSQYLQRCANVGAEVIQMKRKQSELSLRLLSVITKLEVARRGLSPLQPEEIELSRRLQFIEDEINSPTEYKGRIMELLSHLRLQQVTGPSAKYTIDEASLHDIKELLVIQQKSLKHLVETVKSDMSNLALIVDNDAHNDPQNKPHKDPFQPSKERGKGPNGTNF